MSKLCTQIIMQFIEETSFHASLGRTGMKKRASFEIFVRQIRTTVRKWELWYIVYVNSITRKDYSIFFICMVTLKDFILRLKS